MIHRLASRQRSRIIKTTPAVELPISLQEVKSHLGIPDSDEDEDTNLIGRIRAATVSCERYTRRSFVNATYTMFMDRFPGKPRPWWDGVRQGADTELTDLTSEIIIVNPPLFSVTFVKAHKQDGTETTVSSSDYLVDTAGEPGRIALKVTKSWPTDSLRSINGVEVEFIAGYGPVGSDVDEAIRQALLITVADLHVNKSGSPARFEKVGESSISRFSPEEIPLPAKNLLSTYKDWHV